MRLTMLVLVSDTNQLAGLVVKDGDVLPGLNFAFDVIWWPNAEIGAQLNLILSLAKGGWKIKPTSSPKWVFASNKPTQAEPSGI